MALSAEQKSSRLFKKSMGASETLTDRQFFEEPQLGRSAVLPEQIWTDASEIPTTAPTLTNGQSQGIIQYIELLELTHISGSQGLSYYNELLKDTIPFNYDSVNSSYNYYLTKNDGTTQIYFGDGDWLVDIDAGTLTFYGDLPSNVSSLLPPKISFYKYIGEKGIGAGSLSSSIEVKDPVIVSSTDELLVSYDETFSGFTTIPLDVDGITVFNEGDRILVKDQIDTRQNGIYQVSGSTLVRAIDSDGDPDTEVRINNYAFTLSGNTNIGHSWVIDSSDAEDPYTQIIVGVNTQTWKLFSSTNTYKSDGLGLKLDGTTFNINLDEDVAGESGLEQSVDGIKLTDTILNAAEKVDNLNGSGLTYSGGTLNVNVDDWTVKIINNELRTPIRYNQVDKTTEITSGTTGMTNIILSFDPVDYISAYVNGVEYLVSSLASSSETDKPFYFSNYPAKLGDVLYFDGNQAGFGLESNVDLIMIKYHYIDTTI